MSTIAQSVGKDEPSFPDNEDAYLVAVENTYWAVADGAGGGGIYAAEWAGHLVKHVPNKPFRDVIDFSNWLSGIWEPFYAHFDPLAGTDALKAWKFRQEGSYATLATLHWVNNVMHWTAYGDAVALAWNPKTEQLQSSLPDLCCFAHSPFLLNWNTDPMPDGFNSGQWLHTSGQTYALLSDTLAMYVLMAWYAHTDQTHALQTLATLPTAVGLRASEWLNNGCPDFASAIWQPLTNALASRDSFRQYTQQLRQEQRLSIDDYTMIWINGL